MQEQQQIKKKKRFFDDLKEKHQKLFIEFEKDVQKEAQILLKDSPESIPKYTEENQLVRQFIARDYKHKDAMKLWKHWVQWFQENGADKLKIAEIKDELMTGKCFMNGYDKIGNPIVIIQVRKHTPKKIPLDQTKKFFLYMVQIAIEESDRVGAERITVIWDRNGFTKKNYDSDFFGLFKELVSTLQDTYAERIDTMIALFPNWFFKMMYGIVKVFLTKRTKDKIKIVSELKDLQKYVDPDQLIEEHGGTHKFGYNYPQSVFGSEFQQQKFLQKALDEKLVTEEEFAKFSSQQQQPQENTNTQQQLDNKLNNVNLNNNNDDQNIDNLSDDEGLNEHKLSQQQNQSSPKQLEDKYDFQNLVKNDI